jgi:hypothetical protein
MKRSSARRNARNSGPPLHGLPLPFLQAGIGNQLSLYALGVLIKENRHPERFIQVQQSDYYTDMSRWLAINPTDLVPWLGILDYLREYHGFEIDAFRAVADRIVRQGTR